MPSYSWEAAPEVPVAKPVHESAETIINVNGSNDIINVNHYESGGPPVIEVARPAPPVVVLPPPPPPPPPSPRTFDANAARGSLHRTDLGSCGSHAEGHARVTFMPSGEISAVVIDSPQGLTDHEVACIGSKLGAARVPAFDGEPVTAGTTFVVP